MTSMTRHSLLALGLITTLAGCAGLIVGGTAATVGVAHDRRTAGTIVEDQSIEFKASDRLGSDPMLSAQATHINVTSYNNVVLLSGEVPDPTLKQRAGALVRDVEKVRAVHNELAIAAPSSLTSRSSDAWITTKVKSSLLGIDGLPDFDPSRVKVVTERGIVYLFGLVTPQEAEAVTSTVRRVGGVQKVVTLFEVLEPKGGAPAEPTTAT